MNVRVRLGRTTWAKKMPWIVAAVTVVAALAGSLFVLPDVAWRQVWQALSFGNGGGEAEQPRANGDHPRPAAATEVRLTPEKLRSAGIGVGRAEIRPWREMRNVPGNIEYDAGRFKPGMFVWVNVPLTGERQALVVPPGAVMRHEAQAFVFVPADDETFRRVDVHTGLETSEGIEITSGLHDGDRVVDRGAAFLKTELLLDREAD